MISSTLWVLIGSFCNRLERELFGYNYDTCLALHMPPCKLQLPTSFTQPLVNALFVRLALQNEVFIYDANQGKAIYFGGSDLDNYEFAVTTRTALTTPACGEWVVWSGAEERVTLVRDGEARSHTAIVSKTYCFEVQQLPNVILYGGQSFTPKLYWRAVATPATPPKQPRRPKCYPRV